MMFNVIYIYHIIRKIVPYLNKSIRKIFTSLDVIRIAAENAGYCRCREHHCHLTPNPRGTPVNIPEPLILPETRFIGLQLYAAVSMGLSSFKFLWFAPKYGSFQ